MALGASSHHKPATRGPFTVSAEELNDQENVTVGELVNQDELMPEKVPCKRHLH